MGTHDLISTQSMAMDDQTSANLSSDFSDNGSIPKQHQRTPTVKDYLVKTPAPIQEIDHQLTISARFHICDIMG